MTDQRAERSSSPPWTPNTVKVFMFQTGMRHVYLTPKGSISTSYGSVELEDDRWHPWCFDCRLFMPGKGNSGSAMFDLIKHRRTVHHDDLKLVRKLGKVRIRPATWPR